MEHETEVLLVAVLGISLILFLAAGLYLLNKKFASIPYTVLLLVVGLLISPLRFEPFEIIRLSPGSVLFIFLPILLFESAFNFDYREFKKILVPGFLFASFGLLISTAIIALPLTLFFQVDPLAAALFGSVISSTDPIAVLSIFKQLGLPKRLQLLVDGESFLNDGTSVIMFRILLPFVTGTGAILTSNDLVYGVGNFIYVLVGGIAVGILFGWGFSQLISRIKNVSSVEIVLTIILSHLVFIVADHYIKVSGIIAVLAAGLVMGNYGRHKISPKVTHNMHMIWDFLVFIVTSMVFLLIGYEMNIASLIMNIDKVIIVTLALLFGRAISVYLVGGIYNLFLPIKKQIPLNWMHIANWGGLRGALPLIVILSLPVTFEYRELFIQLVLGSILFTLVVNTLTIKKLISYLGVDKLNTANEVEIDITELLILQNLLNYLRMLADIAEISEKTYEKYKQKVNLSLKQTKNRLSQWLEDNGAEEYRIELDKILRRYAVQIEKSVYSDLYKKGVITESVFTRLVSSLDYQVECISSEIEQFGRQGAEKLLQLDDIAQASNRWVILKNIPKLFSGRGQSSQVQEYYMHHKARLLGDEKVIEEIVGFESSSVKLLSDKVVANLRKKYVHLFDYNSKTLEEIEKKYPEETAEVEEKFINAETHQLVEKILEEFGEQDRVSPKALQNLHIDWK